jgi:RimJ/RimL family protein N-acetyltransferase
MQHDRFEEAALFVRLKSGAGVKDPQLSIPVRGFPGYSLQPISNRADRLCEGTVQDLTDWRNRHVSSFLTEFVATPERTAAWLAGPQFAGPRRIMFTIEAPDLGRVGQIGLGAVDFETGYGEVDAVVRGRGEQPGLMSAAMATLIEWAREILRLDAVHVRVRSDNEHALRFYEKGGFVEYDRVPLVADIDDAMTNWREAPGAATDGPSLVYLQFTP